MEKPFVISDISLCEFEQFRLAMYQDEKAPWPDEAFKPGQYLVPSTDVALAMMTKILITNFQCDTGQYIGCSFGKNKIKMKSKKVSMLKTRDHDDLQDMDVLDNLQCDPCGDSEQNKENLLLL